MRRVIRPRRHDDAVVTFAPLDLQRAAGQGLTLVQFSAQHESLSDTKYTLNTP